MDGGTIYMVGKNGELARMRPGAPREQPIGDAFRYRRRLRAYVEK